MVPFLNGAYLRAGPELSALWTRDVRIPLWLTCWCSDIIALGIVCSWCGYEAGFLQVWHASVQCRLHSSRTRRRWENGSHFFVITQPISLKSRTMMVERIVPDATGTTSISFGKMPDTISSPWLHTHRCCAIKWTFWPEILKYISIICGYLSTWVGQVNEQDQVHRSPPPSRSGLVASKSSMSESRVFQWRTLIILSYRSTR